MVSRAQQKHHSATWMQQMDADGILDQVSDQAMTTVEAESSTASLLRCSICSERCVAFECQSSQFHFQDKACYPKATLCSLHCNVWEASRIALYRFAMPWLAKSFSHEGKLYEFPSFNPPLPPPRIKVSEERLRKAERSVSFTSPESDREAPLKLLPVEHDNVSAGDELHRSQDDEIDEERLFERAMVISNLVNHGKLRGTAKLRFQCLGK